MREINSGKEQKKFLLFRLSRSVRMLIYLPLIAVLLIWGVRKLEYFVTYHPRSYSPGPHWEPPSNGENVWFRLKTGERVHGWFVRAIQGPADVTVLYCHGNGGDLTDVGWLAEELSNRKMDVLIFDYRGYGRSEGRLTNEWGLYADAEAAYEYLTRERGVKKERLILHGQSLGTTAAIDIASRHPCAALIVESGLSSASDMGAVALPWLPRWLHFLSTNRFESARKIASVSCPVFIAHGTNDNVIPVEQGRRLYEAAREPKRLMIIEGGDHNLMGNGGGKYFDQISEFIQSAIARR